jgi:hypothetical protein
MKYIHMAFIVFVATLQPHFVFGCSMMATAIYIADKLLQRKRGIVKFGYETYNNPHHNPLRGNA